MQSVYAMTTSKTDDLVKRRKILKTQHSKIVRLVCFTIANVG